MLAAFVDPDVDVTGKDNNVIFYDLCNPKWEIIKITRKGWTIEKKNNTVK